MSEKRRAQIEALIREEVLETGSQTYAAPRSAEWDRANLLYDLVRAVYDVTKMAFADGGHGDTPERNSMSAVADAASKHQDDMFAGGRG